jgi:PST family polysaccharide transporter
MNIRNNRLVESVLSLSILNGLDMILPLITLPYIIKAVGIANFGVYSIVYSIIQYVLLISTYGFNFSATKQIAQNREDNECVNKVFNVTIAAKLLIATVSACLFLIVTYFFFSHDYVLMYLLGLGIVVGDILNPVWLFQGMEKMRYMTIINLICKLLFTILIFIFIKRENDYVYITLLNSVGFLFAGVISLYFACKIFHLRLSFPSPKDIVFQLKDGWYIFLSTIFMSLYRNSNIFILGFFVNETLVGIYAGAEKVIKALQSVASPLSVAFFPYLAESFKIGSIQQKINRIKKLSLSIGGFLLLFSVLICFFAPFINVLLLDGEQNEMVELIRLMVPVVFFGGVNYILGIVGLVNLGFQNSFFKYVMSSGIISIVFLISTVSLWRNYSAAIAMIISEISLFVLCFNKINLLNQK